MKALAASALPPPPPGSTADCGATIAALHRAGADRFDPVRWNFIAALARRAAQQPASVREILEAKLTAALADLQRRFEEAQLDAKDPAAREKQDRSASLGELVHYIEQHAAPVGAVAALAQPGVRPELKAARHFRNTWSKLSVERQLCSAIDQAPLNAGPLNSHFLVLRSLAIMRDIAPDYLNRFTSYVDTLLCLDRAAEAGKSPTRKPAKARSAKK